MSQQLADRIRAVLALDPRAPAIEYEGRWVDWRELSEIAAGVQSCLGSAGLGSGSPVGLVLRNRPAMVGALLGVLLTGGCVVTINPSQGDAGLCADIRELRLPAVVAVQTDWERPGVVDAAAGALGVRASSATVVNGWSNPVRARSAHAPMASPSRC